MKKRHAFGVAVALTLAASLVGFRNAVRAARDLPSRAVIVTATSNWILEDGIRFPELTDSGYSWITNNDLLYFARSAGSSSGVPYKFNIGTKRSERLDGLAVAWQRRCGTPAQAEVSPDGAWILSGDGDNPLISKMDGTGSRPLERRGDLYWLNDSRRIITCVCGSQANRIEKVFIRSIDSPLRPHLLRAVKQFPCSSTPLVTDANHLLTTDFGMDYKAGDDVTVYDVDIVGSRLQRRTIIHLPENRILEIAFSKDGTCILWEIQDLRVSAPMRFLSVLRRCLRLPRGGQASTSLCVSKIDGTEMRLLGRVSCKPGELSHVLWLPDKRNVSFIYKGELYVMPVDEK